ncbi:glycoside hydrolase family 5 protein [Crucibulum laeve]|uniref:Glycoside hydrolase family 5 protein n=1 Tax=Crucibulum laeve TaxID=68775 RepID=A0A5C3M6R8_9AGAR|nr:glycoside hydrolase family 5 protein [Crucibulum laeve]
MHLRQLPFNLLLICQILIFVLTGSSEARQQCRLQVHNAQAVLEPPTNPGTGATSTTSSDSMVATGTSSTSSSTPSSTSSSLPAPTPFNYGSDKIRGVNLGGWLVLEPWITPSFFENTGNDNIVDEFTLGQLMDNDAALNMLNNHWNTWITEDDFKAIQAAGLNHVRIPVGYWSVPLTSSDTNTSTSPAPYIPGAWPYLLKALNWARKHSIHVILDLHGAPGSQNGYDNSGQRTDNPVWAVNSANVTRTVDTLRFIAENIGGMVDVVELLNEAAGFRGDDWAAVVRQFWLDGYGAVKQAAGQGIKVMIGDAFLGVNSWTNFLTHPGAQDVLMDFHEYQIFSDLELNRSFDDHVSFACGYMQSLSSYASSNLWTVVGEWSNAVTDCAQWLNGRGVGARWDGTWFPGPTSQVHGSCTNFTGSYQGFSGDYKTFLRRYWEVQVEIGENIQGWVFWTWKAENADEWSYQKGLEGGWIPQDPTNRLYPNICSGS